MFYVPHELSNDQENEEILVKSRIHFWNFFFWKILWTIEGPNTDLKTHKKSCLWQCNKPYDLKASIRSSFSKTGSKNSLLCKLLIDTFLPLLPPPLTLLLGLLMFQTVPQAQAAIQYRQKLSNTFWNIY